MTSKSGNEIAVLHSIRRPHSDRIKTRVKRWEIRKTKPSIPTPFTDYIYEPKSGGGCGKVIGEFICDKIIVADCDSVALFDRQTKEYIGEEACLTAEEARKYLGVTCGYALHISELKIYDKPKELSEFKTVLSLADMKCKHREERYRTFDGKRYFKCNLQNCVCEFYRLARQTDCDGFENTRERHNLTRPPQSWCYVEENH